MKLAKFHFSSAIVSEGTLFGYAIYSSADPLCADHMPLKQYHGEMC